MRKLSLGLAIAMAFVLPGYAIAGTDRIEEFEYNQPRVSAGQIGWSIGGVDTKSWAGETSFDATIEDASGQEMGAIVEQKINGKWKEIGSFCGSTESPIPIKGGRPLSFSLGGSLPTGCGGHPLQATVGTLTVTYHSD